MIVTKTPLRISWFGGGVDLPDMNMGDKNLVIGGTIERYIWNLVAANGIGLKRHKVNYSKVEEVADFDEIVHPLYREALKLCSQGSEKPVWASTHAEVAYGSGLGGSSAFLVGLLKALSIFYFLDQSKWTEADLANHAIDIERFIIKDKGGFQDQVHAAYCGFRIYKFQGRDFEVSKDFSNSNLIKSVCSKQYLLQLNPRNSSDAHKEKASFDLASYVEEQNNISKKAEDLILNYNDYSSFDKFCNLADESSKLKLALDKKSDLFHEEIDILRQHKAHCIKMTGAGGGGHLAFVMSNKDIGHVMDIFGQDRVFQVSFTGAHAAQNIKI